MAPPGFGTDRRAVVSSPEVVADAPARDGRGLSLSARSIVLGYVVIATLWIALSDQVAGAQTAGMDTTLLQTAKGLGFVAVTAVTLAVLLRRYDARRGAETRDLESSEQRFRLLADHAQDIVFRFGIEAQAFEYVGPAVERVLGYPPSAFYRDPDLLFGIVDPDDRHLLDYDDGAWREAGPLVVRARHADGQWVWLEQRSHLVTGASGEPVAVEGVARDVTAQRQVETALARVNRVQRMLSAANQALVRGDDEVTLLDSICRAVIDEGRFRFAWVGYCDDDEAGTIRPVAHAGHEDGYLEAVAVTRRDTERGRGPAGTAAREGRPVIVRSIPDDPTMAPWAEAAVRRGYLSVAALPLRRLDSVFGILVIYSAEPDAFGPRRSRSSKSSPPTSRTASAPCARAPPGRSPRASEGGWPWRSSSRPNRS